RTSRRAAPAAGCASLCRRSCRRRAETSWERACWEIWRPRAASRIAGFVGRSEADAAEHSVDDADDANAGDRALAEVHALAQGIARRQQRNEPPRQRLDHRNLEREAQISDARRERIAMVEEGAGAYREAAQALPQRRRARTLADVLDCGAGGGECIEGN